MFMQKNKKIILIFDLDGPIGHINSTYPYNFGFSTILKEKKNVSEILEILKFYKVSATFAITGFSAEKTVDAFELKNEIKEINRFGHEIASHSWKHENFSKLTLNQAHRSLARSKKILSSNVVGFVPPHNRPMTWLSKGRFSLGDNRIFPFRKTGDISGIINILRKEKFKWIRISNNSIFKKIGFDKKITNVYKHKDVIVIDGHYCGFDEFIINKIVNSNNNYFCVSAHPLFLSYEKKIESKKYLVEFLDKLTNKNFSFILPKSLIK